MLVNRFYFIKSDGIGFQFALVKSDEIALLARNWFKKNDEFDLKWIGGMKIGPKVYGKQESVKSQDFPPGGKIGSKMAPVNKIFLKVPEIKN